MMNNKAEQRTVCTDVVEARNWVVAQPDERALYNLLHTVAKGRPVHFERSLARDSSRGHYDSKIVWTDESDASRAFYLDIAAGRWDVKNAPDQGHPAIADAMNSIDKMLDAVASGWPIRAWALPGGGAVICWDRQSHGNHPAIVLQHVGTVAFYYDAPAEYRIDAAPTAGSTAGAVLQAA